MQYMAIIGREKLLAQAELDSKYHSTTPISTSAVLVETQDEINIDTLGSVIKIGTFLETVSSPQEIINLISATACSHLEQHNLNSIDFGVSLYDSDMNFRGYQKLLGGVKKQLTQRQVKSRFVSADTCVLNAAQVIHNKLIHKGLEFLIVQVAGGYKIAKTTAVQDIDSYSKRDYARPVRDSKVGMFPPKLAQILINLAQPDQSDVIYDPFCGNGVVLQEAMLMNYSAWGSDNSNTMVEATKKNLSWLENNYSLQNEYKVFTQDATVKVETPPHHYVIVTEGYLGNPMQASPKPNELTVLQTELSELYIKFLSQVSSLAHKPSKIVITLPVWQTTEGMEFLKVIDQIPKLGYTIKQFAFAKNQPLIYKRPYQVVGRNVLVLHINKR